MIARRARGSLAATAAVLLASACTAAPAAPLDPDASLQYPRTLQAAREVEVRVASTGGEDVLVTGGVLESALFTAVAPTDHAVRVWPGHEARVRVPLGEPICGDDAAGADDAGVSIAMTVDGVETTQRVAVPTDVLGQINADECAMLATTETVTVALGEPTGESDGVLTTDLLLDRTGANAPVTVTAVAGSVIFAVDAAPGAVPVTLAAEEAGLDVPLTVRVARCDPHAFAESKKTFLFKVWLAIGGADETYVEVYARGTLRDALQELFDACGEEARGQG